MRTCEVHRLIGGNYKTLASLFRRYEIQKGLYFHSENRCRFEKLEPIKDFLLAKETLYQWRVLTLKQRVELI